MSNQDSVQGQNNHDEALPDPSRTGAPKKTLAQTKGKGMLDPKTPKAKVRILWGGALLSIVVLCIVGWLVHKQQQSAAEEAARERLKQLGALVTMGANRKHVQGVNLSLPGIRDELERAIPLLPKLTYLEVLTLSGTQMTGEQIAYVANCRNLTSLVLKKTTWGDVDLAQLSRLQQLRTLYLTDTSITAHDLKWIGRLSNLTILDLSGTDVEGGLAELVGLDNLEHLLLNDLKLSDKAAETISQLPNLSRLSLRSDDLSKQALEQIKKAKPELIFR